VNPPSLEHDPLDAVAESFLKRWRQGDRPPLSEYTDKHPELAERIHKLFPALLVLEQLGPLAEPGDPPAWELPSGKLAVPGALGEYRILREVARGGMGVVYEAIQESIGRHVALKVLPYNALMSPTQLERFRRGARAAGRLHHANIVFRDRRFRPKPTGSSHTPGRGEELPWADVIVVITPRVRVV